MAKSSRAGKAHRTARNSGSEAESRIDEVESDLVASTDDAAPASDEALSTAEVMSEDEASVAETSDVADASEKGDTPEDANEDEKAADETSSTTKNAAKKSPAKSATKKDAAKKSSTAKRTSRSGNPAKRSTSRTTSAYTSNPNAQSVRPNARWFLPTMLGVFLVGLVWLITFYITGGKFPVEAWGNWNILAGFSFFIIGLGMSTRWR